MIAETWFPFPGRKSARVLIQTPTHGTVRRSTSCWRRVNDMAKIAMCDAALVAILPDNMLGALTEPSLLEQQRIADSHNQRQ